MDVIRIDKDEFNSYLKRTEATYQAENEIIEDKLKQGINGLEWLVMQVKLDDECKESLEQWLGVAPLIAKEKRDPLELLMDSLFLDHESYYEKYELNWWIAIDEALTYLAVLKERNYESYFEVTQVIYS